MILIRFLWGGESSGSGSGGSSGSETTSPATETLTNLSLVANTDTPDFALSSCSADGGGECDESTVGVYEAEDDLGTSYYFRGDVTNNYVKYAGAYWRIIRINGDGSIRMIYDGTSAHSIGDSAADVCPIEGRYNEEYNYNAHVGYMYGSTSTTATYAETHANTTSSTMKTSLDNWYKTNIVDAGYSGNVVDAIYCNDRALASGTGIGETETYYAASNRIGSAPTLMCSQANDRFTVEDTIGTVTGNSALTYPVGTITADEINMAGNGADSKENWFYLLTMDSSFTSWITMTPEYFDGKTYIYTLELVHYYLSGTYSEASNCIRPVISISPDAIQYGDGTSTDPFRTTSAI